MKPQTDVDKGHSVPGDVAPPAGEFDNRDFAPPDTVDEAGADQEQDEFDHEDPGDLDDSDIRPVDEPPFQ